MDGCHSACRTPHITSHEVFDPLPHPSIATLTSACDSRCFFRAEFGGGSTYHLDIRIPRLPPMFDSINTAASIGAGVRRMENFYEIGTLIYSSPRAAALHRQTPTNPTITPSVTITTTITTTITIVNKQRSCATGLNRPETALQPADDLLQLEDLHSDPPRHVRLCSQLPRLGPQKSIGNSRYRRETE